MGIFHHILLINILGKPLMCSCRAFYKFPLIFEQNPEITHIPFCGLWFPGTFNTASDCILSLTCSHVILPAKSHLLDGCSLGFRAYMGCRTGTVAFTESMASCDKCYCLFIIHSHPGKCFPYINTGFYRIRITVRAFRVHINQTHLYCSQWILQIPFSGITFVAKPFCFRTPVYVFFGFPYILTASSESEGSEPH